MNQANNLLGAFLKERRVKLDPSSFGFQMGRRRTPGLRREEVAQLAHISPTWYTWLEQSRGGAPSKEVLNRISSALLLTESEKEYIFILAFGHPPETHLSVSNEITPRLQRILNTFTYCPAIIKTATWDVVAWNKAATKVLNNYDQMNEQQRNTLRYMFTNPRSKAIQKDWDSVAQFIVNTFRADVARIGITEDIQRFIDDLSSQSTEFSKFWHAHNVAGHSGGIKHLLHPALGEITLEYSTFIVEGRPELNMLIFNPADSETEMKIKNILEFE